MEVLTELDRERHKRAELEARVRVLEQEVHIQRRKSSKSSKTSVRDYTMVKTERDGYKEILDALTQDRPAFSTASSSNSNSSRKHKKKGSDKKSQQIQSLPIHIIRLLEVMPWDSRAQQYVFGKEYVYEWQVFSADKKWQKELRHFPTFFKTLPIFVPSPGKTVSDESTKSNFFGTTLAPPKQCVLTDLEGKTILNIDKGYPLPEDGGGWTWVGPWTVEKNNDTDEQGWAYSNETEIMSDASTYHGDFRVPEKRTANITKRRRKWIRPRTLIDYPYASNMTREYLKLIADKSRLESSVDKLSEQLVETKMCLTANEAERERTETRIRELERDLDDKNKILGLVEHGGGLKLTKSGTPETLNHLPRSSDGSVDSNNSSSNNSKKKADHIRSAVTQWVSNTVQKQLHQQTDDDDDGTAGTSSATTNTEGKKGETFRSDTNSTSLSDDTTTDKSTALTTVDENKQQQLDAKQLLLDSLRDKGTGFFEILKQKGEQLDKIKQGSGGGGGLPWQRKESMDQEEEATNLEEATTTPTKSNVYVPSATRVRFPSIGSSD